MPEHCQIYSLSFDGMKGAKISGVHDSQVFEILGEIHGQVLNVLMKVALLEYQRVTLHRNGPSRLPYAGRVWLPSPTMIWYETK